MGRGFDESLKENWVRVASRELTDSDPLQKLSFQSGDLTLLPFYDASDLPKNLLEPAVGHGKPWVNAPKVIVKDIATANGAALRHLEAGADGILFEFAAADPSPEQLLAGIEPEFCSIFFRGRITTNFLQSFSRYVLSRFDPSKIKGAAYQLPTGDYIAVRSSFEAFPKFNALGLELASVALEPAALSQVFIDIQERLTQLSEAAGKPPKLEAAALLISLSDDFFGEMIRMRSLEILWSCFKAAYRQEADLLVHGWSQPVADMQFEPHGNMIAGASRAVSAVVGGVQVLTVEPETNNLLAEQTARNVSFILQEESYLSKISGAVSGSYFIESAAAQLADRAWNLLKAS